MNIEQHGSDRMSNQGPRVRDYTDGGRRLTVDVVHGPAFELLLSLFVFTTGECDDNQFEVGSEWFASIREQASSVLLEEIEHFGCCGEVWLGLIGEAYETREPRTVDAFLTRLGATDPVAVRRHLLSMAFHVSGPGRPEGAVELIEQAAAGDLDAFDQMVEMLDGKTDPGLRRLLEMDPDDSLEGLVGVMRRFNDEIFRDGHDVAAVLCRDADEKHTLAATMPPEQLVETATNGITFELRPEVSGVVLVPSAVLRPWVVISEHGGLHVFAYPVSAEQLGADPDAPSPWMVDFYKALGDERRLRILSRLAEGPATLPDMTEHLGLAKSTTYHHLRVLRSAGLVRVTVGADKTYSLRLDAVPEAGRMLQAYLAGPVGVENLIGNEDERTNR
jgi:DNA-binding transcriptional ArsR family regulator